MTRVSVIVPCRNEVEHIDALLESILGQQVDADQEIEVLVADGMSDDGTREKLDRWSRRWPLLEVFDNPGLSVSAGLNLAVARARGEIIIRLDVHTKYDPRYVAECVRALRETGAMCVGGPWRAVRGTGWQGAIAQAFQSPIGSGGALSRRVDYSGPADTVYLGAWWREDLVRLGGFDERLIRNQDDELNLRILTSGGRVWQSAAIRSYYAPRASLRGLFSQFFQYGYWKIPVILKYGWPASPRHLAPFVLVVASILLLLLAFTGPLMTVLAGLFLAAYGLVIGAAAWSAGEPGYRAAVAVALACMHFGYGLGFGRGLLDFVLLRRGPAAALTRLTR
jgi:glycosyltransferase involved in cell wall biosynthesis